MQVVTLSWVRNESDIIETFVRFHCSIVDKMVIIDHRSNDDTLDILNQLKRENLPIEVRSNRSNRHCQAEMISKLLKEFSNEFDWLIPLDADEFVVSDFNLKQILNSLAIDKQYFLHWHNYSLTNGDISEINVLKRMTHRAETIHNQHKVIIHRSMADIGYVKEGSHEIYSKRTNVPFTYQFMKNVSLAHFPIRSFQQIYQKVFSGWLSQVANHESMPGKHLPENTHWKKIFDKCLVEDVDLEEISKFYSGDEPKLIFDPVKLPPQAEILKYPSRYKKTRLQALADAAEDMAKALNKSNQIISKHRKNR